MDRSTAFVILFAAVAGVLIGLGVSYLIWGGKETLYVKETAKPVIHHDDGTETAPVVVHEPPQMTKPTKPAGGTHVRSVEVVVLPPQPERKPDVGAPAVLECPPVKVRIDLDRYDDGLRASVWSDGEILDTADYPIENVVAIPPQSAIGVAAFTDGSKQVSYTRFFNRIAVTGYGAQDSQRDISAGVGVQFLLR